MAIILTVKTTIGKEILLNVMLTDTIAKLKRKISEKEGVYMYQQQLIFGNKSLSNYKKLNYYGIKNNSILYLLRSEWQTDFKKQCDKVQNALQQTNNRIWNNKQCPYQFATKLLKQHFPTIPDDAYNHTHDKCFCKYCHKNRKDKLIYQRGKPAANYALPIGWCRFGLKTDNTKCVMNNVWKDWHVAFHGTTKNIIPIIFKTGFLLKPGDIAIGGKEVNMNSGHIKKPFKRINKYTNKQEIFDPNQIFVSPSIKYCGNKIYAKPFKCTHIDDNDRLINIKFAFQLRIRPGSYCIGQETIKATKNKLIIDDNFSNNELEWYTKENAAVVLYGLLLHVTDITDIERKLVDSYRLIDATLIDAISNLSQSSNNSNTQSLIYNIREITPPAADKTLYNKLHLIRSQTTTYKPLRHTYAETRSKNERNRNIFKKSLKKKGHKILEEQRKNYQKTRTEIDNRLQKEGKKQLKRYLHNNSQQAHINNSKPNKRKRDNVMNGIEPPLKRIRLLNSNNNCIDYKKENETLKQEIKTLKQKLDSLECKSERIKAMNLNELNELKVTMQNKIKLIEDTEKEFIDNTYKCIACMHNSKNISFIDGCSHVTLCDKCEQSLKTKCCPICQIPYTNVKKINF